MNIVVVEVTVFLRITAVEVAVAATGGALEGARIGGVGGGGRHELATAIKCMAT